MAQLGLGLIYFANFSDDDLTDIITPNQALTVVQGNVGGMIGIVASDRQGLVGPADYPDDREALSFDSNDLAASLISAKQLICQALAQDNQVLIFLVFKPTTVEHVEF